MSRGSKSGSPNITAASLSQGQFNNVPPVADASDDLTDDDALPVDQRPKKVKKKSVAPVITEVVFEGDLIDEPKPVTAIAQTTTEIPESVSEYANMDMFAKVTLMGNLQAALFADDVKKSILSKPAGVKVYEVFSEAMKVELGRIMGAEPPLPEATTAEVMGDYFDAVNQMSHLVRLFSDQKLINLLASLLQQAGGSLPLISRTAVKPPVAKPMRTTGILEAPKAGYNPLFD